MTLRLVTASTLAALLLTTAAQAVSVTNRDGQDHKVTIIEGDAKADHVLKPDAVLQDICQKGCLIRLDDSSDDPYELEGSEVTSIEEGQLYDDEPEAPADPPAGDAGQPSQPGPQP